MNLKKIKNLDSAISDSRLVLASPFMLDPHFKRAVILMCEHSKEDGSLGYILNKQMGLKLNGILAEFPDFDADVYYGGPVSTDTLHYIHTLGDLLPESVKISEGVFWGGDFEELKQLVNMNMIEPKDIRFFIGYTGWSAGQLQAEMREHSWLLGNIDANFVFKLFNKNLWKKVLESEGDSLGVISDIPEDFSWN